MNSETYQLFTTELQSHLEYWPEGFSEEQIEKFFAYYQLVLKWNPHLHLTTITEPADFAIYNILESAFALKHIHPGISEIYDIGTGAGIPGIPISILRPTFTVNLTDANRKKTIFLKETVNVLKLPTSRVINQRFEDFPSIPENACLLSRALDNLPKLTPALIQLGLQGKQIILLGNEELFTKANPYLPQNWSQTCISIPKSKNRYLISFLAP